MRIFLTGVFIGLSLICQSVLAESAVKAGTRKTRLYMAAALFNGREVRFNQDLTSRLEAMGYRVVLPQRDGFEFASMRKVISEKTKNQDVAQMTRDLIYLLDMGVFIPQSDIIVANLDEPMDPGVIVEMTYAHLMGKKVIGIRTDTRTPFGRVDGTDGMHAFVAFQCDDIIKIKIPDNNVHDASAAMQTLAKQIDHVASKVVIGAQPAFNQSALDNPVVARLLQASKLVFKDVKGLHTAKGLETVINNYKSHHKLVSQLAVDTKIRSV